jgi:hypothetical protein
MPEPLCREVKRSLASMPDLATYIIHASNPIACRLTTIIYSHSNRPNLASPALRLVPHRLQMLDNRHVSIQKPIHTVLCASLLSPLQLPAANRPRNAFLPADIRQIVNGCAIHLSAIYVLTSSRCDDAEEAARACPVQKLSGPE